MFVVFAFVEFRDRLALIIESARSEVGRIIISLPNYVQFEYGRGGIQLYMRICSCVV